MSVYKGAKTKLKVGMHLSEELEVNAGVYEGSPSSPPLFAFVIDDDTNEVKEGTLQEILYAFDIVLITVTMAKLQKKNMVGKVPLRVKAG